jgi:hypothetical protein
MPIMELLEPGWWIAGTTTLWSGLGYLDGSGIRRIEKKDDENRNNRKDDKEKEL